MKRGRRIAINAVRVSNHAGSGFDTYIVNIINALAGCSSDFDVYTRYPEHFESVPEDRRRKIDLSFQPKRTPREGPAKKVAFPAEDRGSHLRPKPLAAAISRRLPSFISLDSAIMLWTQCLFPIYVLTGGYELVVSMTQLETLIFCPTRQVCLVYDLIPRLFPEDKHRHQWFLSAMMPAGLRKASRVGALSTNTKADLVRYCGLREDSVDVIPAGVRVQRDTVNAEDKDRFRAKYHLASYILCVGGNALHKNLDTLIEAYGLVRKRTQAADLVIVGAFARPRLAAVAKLVHQHGFGAHVRFLGHISDSEMRIAYSSAELLVFPSKYEGFGMPPLEAMSWGCPVVASRAASIPEVVGAAGVYVDPENAGSIADGVLKVLSDAGKRDELIAEGFRRVAMFSWERSANLLQRSMDLALSR